MEDIKINRVSDETYADIRWYLDSIIPYVNFLSDLCFVDYEGTRYMVTSSENQYVIVAYENGELNPYRITLDENGHAIRFSTEECDYDLSLDFGTGIYGVKKDNRLTCITEQLIYFPNDEELDVTSLDYYQVCQANKNTCVMSYELPDKMTDIGYGLNYASFHQPNKIALIELKKILGVIDHMRSQIFFKAPGSELYRKNLIRLHNILVPQPLFGYYPDILIDQIAKAGYSRNIPEDLKGMIKGDHPAVKRLEHVSSCYQDFIRKQ